MFTLRSQSRRVLYQPVRTSNYFNAHPTSFYGSAIPTSTSPRVDHYQRVYLPETYERTRCLTSSVLDVSTSSQLPVTLSQEYVVSARVLLQDTTNGSSVQTHESVTVIVIIARAIIRRRKRNEHVQFNRDLK